MENPSQGEYQPIDDQPSETAKLIDTSTSSESTAKPVTPRKAPAYDQAVNLPNAEPIAQPVAQPYSSQPYQSYQNAPPPAYQNLPDYNASVPKPNAAPSTPKKFQDLGFTIFFLAWYIPANLIFARLIAILDFGAWWGNSTAPYWGFISAAFVGVLISNIWISITLRRVYQIPNYERKVTIALFTLSAISLSYVARVGSGYSWVYLLWTGCILRILLDAAVTSNEDNYLSASIIQLVKPQLKAALAPIIILQILTFFWILFWGFSYSIISGTVADFPAAHSFLLLVMIWSMMVMRSVVMSLVSAIIANWYNNSGSTNYNTYATTALMDSLVHCFGSVIFASIFVDAFGAITWLLTRIHALIYGKKVKKSVLTKISSKIEKVVNSSSYTIIVPEKQEFVDASQRAHAYLKAASPALRSTTMKYHNFFIALQAFSLAYGGSANLAAAIAGGMFTFAFTSMFHAACIAVTTSYGRDPTFLQTADNALAVQFQQKIGASDKDEV